MVLFSVTPQLVLCNYGSKALLFKRWKKVVYICFNMMIMHLYSNKNRSH